MRRPETEHTEPLGEAGRAVCTKLGQQEGDPRRSRAVLARPVRRALTPGIRLLVSVSCLRTIG